MSVFTLHPNEIGGLFYFYRLVENVQCLSASGCSKIQIFVQELLEYGLTARGLLSNEL